MFRQPWQIGLTIQLPADGLDEGSAVDLLFEKFNTKESPFLFITTPCSHKHLIPWILPAYFCDIHDAPHRFRTCQLAEFSGKEPSCPNCVADSKTVNSR